MDDNFQYAEDGHLQGKMHPNPNYIFINYGFKAYREQEKNYVFLLLVMRNYLRNYFL